MRALGLTQSGTSQLMQTNGQQQKDSDAYRGNLHTTQYHQSKQLQAIKSTCILMRGLPYSCTESDITKFFQEIDVTPIRIHRKADGAEAYVEFYNVSDTDAAMNRHRSYIGRRYIELFRVTYEDMARTVGLPMTSTNIPASALALNSSLMLNPLYALSTQRRTPQAAAQSRRPHIEPYHPQQSQPQHPAYHPSPSHRVHYQQQQAAQHGSSQPQQVLLSAANINMNAAALMSQSNGLGLSSIQNSVNQQQQQQQRVPQQPQHPSQQLTPQYYQ